MVGGRSVPVLLAVRSEDDIAGGGFDDVLAPHLDTCTAFGHAEGLAAIVGVPRAASAWSEVHGGHVEL